MKHISRREFSRLAVVGAAAAPLAGALFQASKASADEPAAPTMKPALTEEQQKKLGEEVARRERDRGELRGHTLPYGGEPAFVFHVRVAPRRSRGRS
jgi:hypothetical protein